VASFRQFIPQAGAIVLGGVLALIPGTQSIGIGLLVSGALGVGVGLLTAPGGAGLESSPTYRLDVATNFRGEGEPIPMVYGEDELTPPAISTLLDTDGDSDVIESVYLLGRGPMLVHDDDEEEGGEDLLARCTINDVPLAEVDPLAVVKVLRETTAAGTLEGFSRIARAYAQARTKLEKDVVHSYTMKADADAVHMVFDWPNGILKLDSKGRARTGAGGVKFEYRTAGSSDTWTAMDLGAVIKTEKTIVGLIEKFGLRFGGGSAQNQKTKTVIEASKDNPDWWPTAPEDGVNEIKEGVYWVKDATRSHIRKVAKFKFPSNGTYEIRLTGQVDDDANDVRAPVVHSIFEVEYKAVTSVTGLTILGLKIHGNEQLRNQVHVFKIVAKGRQIAKAEASYAVGWTNNGISVAYDILTDTAGGLGLAEAVVGKTSTWDTLAAAVEAETYTIKMSPTGETRTGKNGRCNLVMDTRAAARDWLNHVLATFRGVLYEAEGLIEVAREAAGSSARTFESRPQQAGRYNIVRNEDGSSTLDVTQVPETERYTKVSVRFVDSEDGWQQRTVSETEQDAGEDDKEIEIFMPAITTEYQALRKARFLLGKARDARDIARWQVAWGDLDLLPMEVVTVNAEWPQWTSDTKDFVILAIHYAGLGVGTIIAREYVAALFTATPTNVAKNPGGLYVPAVSPQASAYRSAKSGGNKKATSKPGLAGNKKPQVPAKKATNVKANVIGTWLTAGRR
jgi:hypothetical protein